MRDFKLGHLAASTLRRQLPVIFKQIFESTAMGLAYLGEYDEQRLYLEDGFPSMHAYCRRRLGLARDVASRYIHAARTARRYPALFEAIEDRRLELTGIRLLAAYLTPENVDELTASAARLSCADIRLMLVKRFGPAEMPSFMRSIPWNVPQALLPIAESAVEGSPVLNGLDVAVLAGPAAADDRVSQHAAYAPKHTNTTELQVKSTPECFELHCIIDRETHDLIEYARSLSHRRQDIPQVLKHALELAVAQLEKEKFGASSSPRVTHATSRRASPRYIPAAVKLAVWKRDEGHCTFVGTNGERCGSQHRLEYDHILPVARGGQSTADNLRLRCRPHNQLEAELVYGTDFMRQKRKPA